MEVIYQKAFFHKQTVSTYTCTKLELKINLLIVLIIDFSSFIANQFYFEPTEGKSIFMFL